MVLQRSERTHPMGRTRTSGTMLEPPTAKTLGWSPSCECKPPADVLTSTTMAVLDWRSPCTILDPFGGAGTTALVADRLGRDCILIELNPEYAEMARKRIAGDAGLFAEVGP